MKVKTFRHPERARSGFRRFDSRGLFGAGILRSRKGQIQETQFNWIFVLIVGALIMAFFVFIVMKQKAASETKFAGKASQMLNTILVGAKVSSGTVQEIETPDLEIQFTCDDYFIGPTSQRLGNRIVFAPEYVEGDRLITWTKDWNVPFKVASFLYITTPNVRYIITGADVGPGSDAKWLFDLLPDQIYKELRSTDEMREVIDENDPYVRIIIANDVGGVYGVPANLEDVDVSGLVFQRAEGVFHFLEQDGTRFIDSGPERIEFTEDEVLFGAVFADSSDTFVCLMRRAYARLNVVAKIYLKRLDLIEPEFRRTNCEGLYGGNANINTIITESSSYPPEDIGAIAEAKTGLLRTNDDAQLKSCPLLY